ncbi:uncharacterized protein LOC106644465 [Copidosoma floridanum]|uniref:uncharacterized protein LOC106644465 n=1 Tax=Copidosoma floridanum TaxID=29053 RepID=UPI0006C95000|nr:uncharacterized protein LOC106644465 [Copidosoma floridanum]XP_014215467.1 uncharacterized protein LOC106644465 [Copidosoma floridanum]
MLGIRWTCALILVLWLSSGNEEVSCGAPPAHFNFTEFYLYKLYANENETLGLDENHLVELRRQVSSISFSRVLKKVMMRLINVTKDSDKIDYMRREIYDVYQMVVNVENTCEELAKYRRLAGPVVVTRALKELFREALDRNTGLNARLQKSLGKIVLWKGRNIVDALETHIEEFEPLCRSTKSRRQYFYEFFLSMLSYEIKGYVTLSFVLEMKKEAISNFEKVRRDAYVEAKHRVDALTGTLDKVIKRASREMYRCDPERPKENKTYVELKNVFRRILYHESDFSKSPDNCYGICPKANATVAPLCKKHECYLPQRHCNNVIACNQVDFKDSYDVCILKDRTYGRRYSFVLPNEFSFNPFYNRNCKDVYRLIQTYTRGFIRPTICKSCNCICNENHQSERYISLDSVTSDVDNNYVVTGVQFVKQNNTLYMQVQQGKLLPYGWVKNNSTSWNNVTYCIANLTRPEKKLKLEWFNGRGILLDDLRLPKLSEIVTGVRFTTHRNGSEHFIKLEIQSTPYDIPTGRLSPEYSYWYSSIVPLHQRKKVDLDNLDLPSYVNVTNKLDGIASKYTRFTPTGFTTKDAGQSLLPLIDIQRVFTDPASPLTGLSLDLKKNITSGGYLTLKLNTLDLMDKLEGRA